MYDKLHKIAMTKSWHHIFQFKYWTSQTRNETVYSVLIRQILIFYLVFHFVSSRCKWGKRIHV